MLNRNIWTVVLGASVLLGANVAEAAAVSSTAALFGLTQSGASVRLSNDNYTQDVQSSLGGNSFTSDIVAKDLTINLANGASTVYAESSYSLFSAPYTSAGAISNPGSGFHAWASSDFIWSFDYVAAEAGTVTLDFEYNYVTTISNLADGDTAGASALIGAYQDGTGNAVESYFFLLNQNASTDGIQHLLLNFNVAAGQKGSITFNAASQVYVSAVPVPAAVWLLGSALGGFGLVGRRRA